MRRALRIRQRQTEAFRTSVPCHLHASYSFIIESNLISTLPEKALCPFALFSVCLFEVACHIDTEQIIIIFLLIASLKKLFIQVF